MNKQRLSVLLLSAAVAFLVIFVFELISYNDITLAYWWLMLFLACYIGYGYVKGKIRQEEAGPNPPKSAKKHKKKK